MKDINHSRSLFRGSMRSIASGHAREVPNRQIVFYRHYPVHYRYGASDKHRNIYSSRGK